MQLQVNRVYKTNLDPIGYSDLPPVGLFANAPAVVDSVTKISTTMLTKAGAGGWTLGMSAGTYLGVSGTPDDLAYVLVCADGAGFTRRWYFYNGGKCVGPAGELALQSWVNARFGTEIPVGVVLPWSSPNAPDGWVSCVGQTFNAAGYPQLAAAYPSGVLPDLRGVFIRGWDNGRNIDPGRSIMSQQGGQAAGSGLGRGAWGNYAQINRGISVQIGTDNDGYPNVMQEAESQRETRPVNLAFNYIVRLA